MCTQNCPNVFSARKFVSWYNGHPDHINDIFDLDTEVAAVVGHGNVALDVARILLKQPDELKVTIPLDLLVYILLWQVFVFRKYGFHILKYLAKRKTESEYNKRNKFV